MRACYALACFALSWAVPAAASAQAWAVPEAIGVPVRADGLVGSWYPPASGKRGPAILVLGGSEGGENGSRAIGAKLAAQGYGVLALAYFRAEGLPQALQNIPLEYFDRAIAWLAARPEVDRTRLGLYGISIGGEVALVVAARHPELKAVIAAVPSSVVWQGFDPADYTKIAPTFTDAGKPVPYLPYDNGAAFTGIFDLYRRSLDHLADHPDAVIPVERIGGAVLLLSARDDKLWPSTAMAEQVMARLAAHHFRHSHEHVAYPDAGHGGAVPGDGRGRNSAFDNLGGTPAGNAAARADVLPRMTGFFRRYLGAPAQ